jgi:hypothetical protein
MCIVSPGSEDLVLDSVCFMFDPVYYRCEGINNIITARMS